MCSSLLAFIFLFFTKYWEFPSFGWHQSQVSIFWGKWAYIFLNWFLINKVLLLLDPRLREGPMNSVSFVRNTFFSELAHYFFLIFCMKLGVHEMLKSDRGGFFGKILIFSKMWKKCPKSPKNRVFGLLRKFESLLFARNDLKWSVLWYFCANPISGKTLVLEI